MTAAQITFEVLKVLACIAAVVPLGLGLLVIFSIVRPQKAPVDSSNRINKVRLIWFAINREDKFVTLFPWLKRDEWDNLYGDGEASVAVGSFKEAADTKPGLSD